MIAVCVCDPPCQQFEGDWPTEQCPNPDCDSTTDEKPVGISQPTPGAAGLTFHCTACPCRWYSVYEYTKK